MMALKKTLPGHKDRSNMKGRGWQNHGGPVIAFSYLMWGALTGVNCTSTGNTSQQYLTVAGMGEGPDVPVVMLSHNAKSSPLWLHAG